MTRGGKPDTVWPMLLEVSGEWRELTPGWMAPTWAKVRFTDKAGLMPLLVVRADLVGEPGRPRAVITSMVIGDESSQIKAAQLRELAYQLPDLPARVLSMGATIYVGDEVPPYSEFVRALKAAMRRPVRSQVEREDDVLDMWDRVYKPSGKTQREAAEDMGLAHTTFRSYLAHARRRRGL